MTSIAWAIDRQEATRALDTLSAAKHVLFVTHQNVDADGLASPLAIAHGLWNTGVAATVMLSDGQLPGNLTFLPGCDRVLRYGIDPLPDYDVLCLVDCSDRRRLSSFYSDDPSRVEGGGTIVNIDHHITNDHFGVVNIVEPHAASTAELVTDLFGLWSWEITVEIASCLLAGIYGDTLGLRTEATTAKTMRFAADLVDAGANPSDITDALFRVKPASTVCLWHRALGSVEWTGQVIWAEVTPAMLAACNAQASEAEGLVNFLTGTEGTEVAAILYANDSGWRISMRSLEADVDVARIASEFGGGGHPRAAGVQVTGGEPEKQAFLRGVAEAVREMVRQSRG